MNETAFNDWWNASYDAVDNPFKPETPAWWSWAAWQEATKVEREACAKVCDEIVARYRHAGDAPEMVAANWCADGVRARGSV